MLSQSASGIIQFSKTTTRLGTLRSCRPVYDKLFLKCAGMVFTHGFNFERISKGKGTSIEL